MKLNKILTTLIIITLNMLCYSQFSGGTGTVEDPYNIATAEDLNNIRYYLTSSFIQTADIDLGVAPWNEGEGWDPIGNYDPFDSSKSFSGNYNGNKFIINNLYINRPTENYLGLFGSTEGCVLSNITILNCQMFGGSAIGGLVAFSYNDFFLNCRIEGMIEASSGIGLLAYFFEGYNIENCYVKGKIKSTNGGWIGGLISICQAIIVDNCSSEIIIESNGIVTGGLFGQIIDLTQIENSFVNCNITSTSTFAAGFVAINVQVHKPSFINNCYATGDIFTIDSRAGGFIGDACGDNIESLNIHISNCFTDVNITGQDHIGGFIGSTYENADIYNCYSTGLVTGNSNIGGFIGSIDSVNTVTVTNCYWDMETSGIDSSAAGEGRTTADMTFPYSGNTYVGWDFANVWRDDTANQNNGYPTFQWVSGIEEDDDYIIPKTSKLYQNYPNPFNPVTQIKFDLAKAGNVKLSVYNINGQKIAELLNGVQNAGTHSVQFDGSNLNSGVYYYTLETDGIRQTNKMILTK